MWYNNNSQMHVLQARTLEILRGTLTWFHTPLARRKRVDTLFLGVQVVVGCSMFGNRSSSIEHASRGPQGMTPSGLKFCCIIVVHGLVEMVAGEVESHG